MAGVFDDTFDRDTPQHAASQAEGQTQAVRVNALEASIAELAAEIAALKRQNSKLHEELDKQEFEQRLFQTQQEAALDGILLVDATGKILSYNRRFVDMWQIPHHVIDSRSDEAALAFVLEQLANPDEFLARVRYFYCHHEEIGREEIALRNGKTFERYTAPVLSANREHLARIWWFRDISERKAAEMALTSSESRLRRLVETVPVAIVTLDVQHRILEVNTEAIRLLRCPRNNIIDREFTSTFVTAEARATMAAHLDQVITGRTIKGLELPLLTADNEERIVDWHIDTLEEAELRAVSLICVGADVTENRNLEQQLRQAQKLEAIGRLAGGVAHDFNNLLTSITGNLLLALMDLEPTHPVRELLLESSRSADSASALTRQLLAFSRRQIIAPKVIMLDDLIADMHKMIARLVGEHIEFTFITQPNLFCTRLDPTQIEQVIVNLALNARDAMPDGGRLTVETSNTTIDQSVCGRHPDAKPGQYVVLSVSDCGHGMSLEVKKRIFEPFFTTKRAGKGTGLGLATVYGAVQQHQGFIEVVSEPERGTTFRLYFPRTSDTELEEASPETRHRSRSSLPRGMETILIAEDAISVGDFAKRTLQSLGYHVLLCRNPAETLALLDTSSAPIHLLLTDVVMPGMNGRALAELVVAKRPQIKVLYTSGYTDDVFVHHGVLDDGLEFLGKPYSPRELAEKVRTVIGEMSSTTRE